MLDFLFSIPTHPDFTIWFKSGRVVVNRGRNRDCVTGALLFWSAIEGVMHFENSKWAWSGNTTITNCRQPRGTARKSRPTITRQSSNMYFHSQKRSQMIFFVFFFQISKIAFPGIMIPLGHLNCYMYIRPPKLILGLLNEDRHQTSARLYSLAYFFEYAFPCVLFWLIFICAYLWFYSNVPFVRHVTAALRITLVACIINHVDLGKVWKEQSQRYGRYVQRKPDVAACQQ